MGTILKSNSDKIKTKDILITEFQIVTKHLNLQQKFTFMPFLMN